MLKETGNIFANLTGIEVFSQSLSYAVDDEQETTLAVPGYLQTKDYTCGFVAGLMVLHTFKPKASIDRFYNRCSLSQEYGLSTQALTKALRESAIGVSIKRKMTHDQIAEAIENGCPIISTVKWKGIQHWIVIYGYGVGPDRVFVAGMGLPWLPLSTASVWSKFKKMLPIDESFLVCWGK